MNILLLPLDTNTNEKYMYVDIFHQREPFSI